MLFPTDTYPPATYLSLSESCGNDPLMQQLIATTEAATLARVVKSIFSYSIHAKKH